jgi:RHS repeat-associated protein
VNANGFIAARFDFTAFGEKISLGIGLRSIDQGYSAPTNARQGYGLTETDSATGLDHTWFRKNENRAGRFTSPDPYKGSMSLGSSGSFNRYSYVENQPTNFVDPSGLCFVIHYSVWSDGTTTIDYVDFSGCNVTTSGSGGGGGGFGSGGMFLPEISAGIEIDGGGGGGPAQPPGQPPPLPTPQTGKPGTEVPKQPPSVPKLNPGDPRNMNNPGGKWGKIRVITALVLKLLSEFLKSFPSITIPIMVDPKVLCEEARKEGSPLANSVLCTGGPVMS